METIFDYNPTEEELDVLYISYDEYNEEPDNILLKEIYECRTKEGFFLYLSLPLHL